MQTKTGGTIELKNFYPQAVKTLPGYVVIKETPYYRLIFYEADTSFVISIINANVPTARAVAELEVPDTLGISQQEACQLRISIGVSLHVSETYGGKSYGLGFCQ